MKYWIITIAYLCLLQLFFANYLKDKKKQLAFILLAMIPLFVLMGLRNPTSYHGDILNYYNMYYKINSNTLQSLIDSYRSGNKKIEIGFKVFCWLIGRVFKDAQALYIFYALIVLSSVGYYIYKNSDYPFYCILAYMSFGGMAFQMTGIRQAIAMAICLYSIEFAKRKKIVWFLLLVWLAYTFHSTTIVFVFAYFLYNRELDLKAHIIIAVLALAFVLNFERLNDIGVVVFNKDESYSTANYKGSAFGGLMNLFLYVFSIILVYFYKKQKDMPIVNVFLLAPYFYVARYIQLSSERIAFYFIQTGIIIMPNTIFSETDRRIRNLERVVFIIGSIAYFIYTANNAQWGTFYPCF